MRVVLDVRTATDHFPGIGRYVVNLAQALSRIAPDLELQLLYDPAAEATRHALPDLPRLPCATSPFSARQQWSVPPLVRRARADLYHSAYYLMPYRPGAKAVLTYYDLIPLVYPQYYSRWQPLLFRLASLLALRSVALTLAISEATKTDLVRRFGADPSRIVVTPLAADPRMRPATPDEIAASRRRYHLPDHYALYLGINKPHKNLVRLIEAWARSAMHKSPDTRLVISGHWDERYPQARQRADELGLSTNVCFVGPVKEVDLPALYSGSTAFVFPSLYEGFGLPVLEAMACGAPVICSNASSLPEVAGDAAILVDPLDVQALATAIDDLLGDKERQAYMHARGPAQAARFSWDHTAHRTLEAYRRLQ